MDTIRDLASKLLPNLGRAGQNAKLMIDYIIYWQQGIIVLSYWNLLLILLCLLYFISPIDLIPDVIPVVGYVDDIGLLLYGYKLLENSLKIVKDLNRVGVGKNSHGDGDSDSDSSGSGLPNISPNKCVLCQVDRSTTVMFASCGHQICCRSCVKQLAKCPKCKTRI